MNNSVITKIVRQFNGHVYISAGIINAFFPTLNDAHMCGEAIKQNSSCDVLCFGTQVQIVCL
jgi:hypothetical protein